MGDEDFNESILTDKLSKFNSSQQSIESLSRWCISHRKKAKQVVETWGTLFNSAPHAQQVSLLYLANDILQNSRRKGSDFVNEFWKVLPAALKNVYDSGEENCRKVAFRLIGIWEERRVFGSLGQNLKNETLGKNLPLPKNSSAPKNPSPVINGKNANPIKVLKRDDNSLRIILAVGGLPEKIISAFRLVHDEIATEEATFKKCRTAVSCVQEIKKDVVTQGSQPSSDVLDNIQIQEKTLQQCISRLEKIEANRVALVSQLREALQDQESKVELIRSELLVARGQVEQVAYVRTQLTTSSAPPMNQVTVNPTLPPDLPTSNPVPASLSHRLPISVISEEESKRAVAAAVAAKLTASTSSAEMLTSVLSSLVAEEGASVIGSSSSSSSSFKRPKLERPSLSFADANTSEGPSPTYFSTTQPAVANIPPPMSQMNPLQAPFVSPPHLPPPTSTANQLVPSPIMGLPYGYGATNLPPPLMPSNPGMGYSLMQNQHQPQQPTNGTYCNPGIGFYGQNHQPPTPPAYRQ